MLEILLVADLAGTLFAFLIGISLLLFLRIKTKKYAKGAKAVGFWVRAFCLSLDLVIIRLVSLLFAYHGSVQASGYITAVIAFSYFFFFWLFSSATFAQKIVGTQIVSTNKKALKTWQVSAKVVSGFLLLIGWISILFDKKEKKSLHDILSKTKVIYGMDKKNKRKKNPDDKLKWLLLSLTGLLLISLIFSSFGENINKFQEGKTIHFYDMYGDGAAEALTIDLDSDGITDVYKYDLDNDNLIDFTSYDTDKNGIAESIDVNNDGRVDGFDLDNDSIIDMRLNSGQFWIWLDKIWFGAILLGLLAALMMILKRERN